MDFKISWIESKIDSTMNTWAEKFTSTLGPKISSTQLRRFFSEIRKIQTDFSNNKEAIYMLSPKLAYSAARNLAPIEFTSQIIKALSPVCISLDKAEESATALKLANDTFNRFALLMEAIVAYYKEKK